MLVNYVLDPGCEETFLQIQIYTKKPVLGKQRSYYSHRISYRIGVESVVPFCFIGLLLGNWKALNFNHTIWGPILKF